MVQRYDPFETYGDLYGEIIDWEHDPMNKPANQNKYFFSDGKTYYEQILKMLKLMSVFKASFKQIYDNEDEITGAWENFVDNLTATATVGEHADVTLTWQDGSVSFDFVFEQGPQGPAGPTGPQGPTGPTGPEGPQGVSITNITFNSDYTMSITLSNGNTYTSESLRGATGPTGPEGPQGPAGQGLQILDTYPTLSDLQTAHPTGQPGDAYQVGTAPNFTLYIWSSSQSQWVPAGTLGTVSPSLTDPLMDGTASAGSSDLYSRGDHVHPTDTSRASVTDLNNLSDIINESESLLNQEFTYRQSPAEHDGLVNIDKIKGNTLVFNQLAQNGNFINTDNWNPANGTISASSNVLSYTITSVQSTFQGNRIIQQIQKLVGTHKYLVFYDIYPLKSGKVGIRIDNDNTSSNKQFDVVANKWNRAYFLFTYQNIDNYLALCFNAGSYQVDDVIQVKNVNVFDLTLMFGSGNEPTSVSDFTDLFPLLYYNYDAGSLLSFNGTGLKTTGKNLFNPDLTDVPLSNCTGTQVNGVISLTATGTDMYVNRQAIIDSNWSSSTGKLISVLPNTQYTLKLSNSNFNKQFISFFNNNLVATRNYVTTTSSTYTFTTGYNEYYIVVRYGVGNAVSGTTYSTTIQLEKGNTATTYEPYIENTLSLPISTYFATGMKSARNIYDELAPSKAITRVGTVDLGSLTWTKVSGYPEYRAIYTDNPDLDIKGNSVSGGIANLSCSKYIAMTGGETYRGTNTGISANTSYISIGDSLYNDLTSFLTGINGVMLNYELITPTEQDIDIDLTYPGWNGGTEQILPVNTATPTTSPIISDMTYMGINDEILYLNNNSGVRSEVDALKDDVTALETEIGSDSTTPMTGLAGRVKTNEDSISSINNAIGSESTTPMTGLSGRVNTLESNVSDIETEIGSDSTTPMTGLAGRVKTNENSISSINTTIGSESTTPKTGILGRVNALENDVSDIETEIGSDSTTPMTGLAGRVKTIENALNNLKGKVVFEYTSTSSSQGLTTSQLDLSDLNNATHIEVIYSVYKNGNDTLSTGIIPYKFYNPSSIEIAGTISEHQIDQDRGRPWGINSSGLLTISSCITYYPDSSETSNDYLIIRQVILYKFTRASSLI